MNEQNILKVTSTGFIDQRYALTIGRKWFDAGEWYGEVASLTYAPIKEYTVPPPTITMSKQEAQVLMDSLWDSGIRPTEGAGSAGSLAATQKHLQDMRKIVFKQLKIK